jgi:NAD(P)H-flavin reductase
MSWLTSLLPGVAPIYALARAFLMAKRPVTLLAFNHTPQDSLGEEQIQQARARCVPLFAITHFR